MAKVVTKKTAAVEARTVRRLWLIRLLLTGLGVGFLVWLFTLIISQGVISPIFCNSPDQFIVCANGGSIASNIAILLASVLGLLTLARFPVARPLLIVVASAITLWGIGTAVGILHWAEALAWTAGISAISYLAYGWILKMRSGWVAVVVAIAVIVIARLVTTL